MVRSTSRGLLLVGTLWSAPALAQLPNPPAGEYRCTQSDIALAGVSSTGLPAATAVVARPGMMGNLVIDRMGGYRMTATNASRASYRYEPTGARVIFTGQLAGLSNSYGTRGRNVFFDFSNASIGFSCELQTSTDYGQQVGVKTGPDGAPVVTTRTALAGTLYFSDRRGIARLNLSDGTQSDIASAFQFDVRGEEIVFITAQGGVAISALGGGGVRNVPAYGNSNQSPRFSPDGQRIALLGNQRATSVEDAMLAANSNADAQPLVISRDGRVQVAFGSGYAQPTWTADGRLILVGNKALGNLSGSAQTGLFLSNGRSTALRRIDPNFDAPHSPAVSPDGSLVAFVNGTKIWVMPLNGGAPKSLIDGSRFLGALAWSPDGQSLVFADNQEVKAVSRDGRPLSVQGRAGFGVQTTGTMVWR
jgi:Tol biopolymer transport system component